MFSKLSNLWSMIVEAVSALWFVEYRVMSYDSTGSLRGPHYFAHDESVLPRAREVARNLQWEGEHFPWIERRWRGIFAPWITLPGFTFALQIGYHTPWGEYEMAGEYRPDSNKGSHYAFDARHEGDRLAGLHGLPPGA